MNHAKISKPGFRFRIKTTVYLINLKFCEREHRSIVLFQKLYLPKHIPGTLFFINTIIQKYFSRTKIGINRSILTTSSTELGEICKYQLPGNDITFNQIRH